MSDTTAAFQGALDRLAAFSPAIDTRPALDVAMPRREVRMRPGHARGRLEEARGPLLAAARGLRSGETSSVALVESALAAMARSNAATNAVVTSLGASALREAERLDLLAASGAWQGPLHGIPFTVKDNLHVAGAPTYAGSKAYTVYPTRDAASVALARRAGGLPVAKVATHEFALGVTTPQARHPLDPERIPGGSSGGGAISIATGMALASLATDTRASIRVPAALCGVVGYKPTLGWLPPEGVVWLSWTMDHIGLLTASVADAAYVGDALVAGRDLLDDARQPVAGLRIGVPGASFSGADPAVASAVRAGIAGLRAAGAEIVDLAYPDDDAFELANAAGLVVSRAEALEYHRGLGTDLAQVWPETADQLRLAGQLSIHQYLSAQRFRTELAHRMLAVLADASIDTLVMPTTLVTAPLVAEAERYFTLLSRNAIPWSLVGWPVVSVPCGHDQRGLPIGLQVVAPPDEDALALRVARAVEQATASTPTTASGNEERRV